MFFYDYSSIITQCYKLRNFHVITIKETPVNREFVVIPDPRAVCIANLFTRGMIYHANTIVGDIVPKKFMLNVNNFDGQLFQWLYLIAKENNSTEELCRLYLSEDEKLELVQIFNFVTNDGTKIKILN